ncbi:MAG TPA: hypothetical protein VJ023_00920, partial [Pyrinomonadaceae bacterium]|nr:hypothetical protein [Pyrinomonadaceae bacterium]
MQGKSDAFKQEKRVYEARGHDVRDSVFNEDRPLSFSVLRKRTEAFGGALTRQPDLSQVALSSTLNLQVSGFAKIAQLARTVGASAWGTKHLRQRASYMPLAPTATRSSDSKVL